jgi:hypothetical protein
MRWWGEDSMQQKHALTTVRALRDFFNESIGFRSKLYENQDKNQWLLFHTALDTIEDSSIAVDTFQQQSAEHVRLNPLLTLAGLLQLLYVQLDAVKFLVDSSQNNASDEKKFFGKNIMTIRYLRNQTIGHPVKNTSGKRKIAANEITYTILPVLLINESSFTYTLQYVDGTNKKHERAYQDICQSVDDFIHEKITLLLEQFQQEEQLYKAQFSNTKLAMFNLERYQWYKSRLILDASGAGDETHNYQVIYSLISKDIEEFSNLLNARISLTSQKVFLENGQDILLRLNHIMTRLSPDTITDITDFDVQIYVDALIQGISELHSIALELDEKYEHN